MRTWSGLGILAIVGLIFASFFIVSRTPSCIEEYEHDKTIIFNGQTIRAEAAETQAAQEQGLSGKECIPANRGMLFINDASQSNRCFWMKDMQFPIDILWLDSDKRVVHKEVDISPDTYPKTFCSDKNSQYVLEIKANESQILDLNIGDTVSF